MFVPDLAEAAAKNEVPEDVLDLNEDLPKWFYLLTNEERELPENVQKLAEAKKRLAAFQRFRTCKLRTRKEIHGSWSVVQFRPQSQEKVQVMVSEASVEVIPIALQLGKLKCLGTGFPVSSLMPTNLKTQANNEAFLKKLEQAEPGMALYDGYRYFVKLDGKFNEQDYVKVSIVLNLYFIYKIIKPVFIFKMQTPDLLLQKNFWHYC